MPSNIAVILKVWGEALLAGAGGVKLILIFKYVLFVPQCEKLQMNNLI